MQLARRMRKIEDQMCKWTGEAQLKFLQQPLGTDSASSTGACEAFEGLRFRCACGGELETQSFSARRARNENRFNSYLCDACGCSMKEADTEYMWTCAKKTVVHPRGNDFCAKCVQKHAGVPPEDRSKSASAAPSEAPVVAPASPTVDMALEWRHRYEAVHGTCQNADILMAFARNRGGCVTYREARRALLRPQTVLCKWLLRYLCDFSHPMLQNGVSLP